MVNSDTRFSYIHLMNPKPTDDDETSDFHLSDECTEEFDPEYLLTQAGCGFDKERGDDG
jgi:hypothetical protein